MKDPRPEEIAATLERLGEAGRALRRRPAREALDAIAATLDRWHDPASPWRRALERELPAAAGFSPETVRKGLALGLEAWTGDALLALVDSELGGGAALEGSGRWGVGAFDVTAVLLAGALPMPTLLGIFAPLTLRSPVLAKSSSHDPVTAPLVARSLGEADEGLGRCVEVAHFAGSDVARTRALLRAECVAATGSDETIAAVAAQIHPPQRLVAHGHRLSFAVLGPEAGDGAGLDDLAGALALDTALWDQLGCLSPIAVYAVSESPDAADRIADALCAALVRAEARWPRGRVPVEAEAAIARERAEAEMRAATGRRVRVLCGADGRFTVVREDDARIRPAPLHRFLRVHPVPDLDALVRGAGPLGRHLAAVAMGGFGRRAGPIIRALTKLGASRICEPGRLQAPPLGWRRDHRGVLGAFARASRGA